MKYIVCLLLFVGSFVDAKAIAVDSLSYGVFGKVILYKPEKTPDSVVLFVSGDGGWNEGVVTMAKNVVAQGGLVVGINILHYLKAIKTLKTKCYYPASDLEDLSLTIQKKLKFKQYLKPILFGYSSGATLVYGALAQAPANTFKGAIGLGFSPDIEIDKPLCKGAGLQYHAQKDGKSFYLEPFNHLTAPFIALQGESDLVCSVATVEAYFKDMPETQVVPLPKVGHGFAVVKNWVPQFSTAYQTILAEPSFAERKVAENSLLQAQHIEPLNDDLPIVLLPTLVADDLPVVIFISGDGGWTSFDHSICETISSKGMPVVGLDAQKYFWNAKEPKEVAAALENAALFYMRQWNRHSFILVGYSFGGCVAPFIANDFSYTGKNFLKGVYCISPSETADFEIHLTDMLSLGLADKYDVLKEVVAIKPLNPVCIIGADEETELKEHFRATGVRVEILPGSHHYNNDFNALANVILNDFLCDK